MKKDLSIVIATYNRIESLIKLIENINITLALCSFKYEIIISDNASTDSTQEYFSKTTDPKIKYFRNKTNIGFYKNFLNGLKKAEADLVWLSSDDDNIGEAEFFEEGIKNLQKKEADLVFGRLQKRSNSSIENSAIDRYNFQKTYTPSQYLDDWINIRERLSSSCFIYKKEIFLNAVLKYDKDTFFGGTIDYTLHYEIIKKSSKIIFIDKIAYTWTISRNNKSISGTHRSDLMWQMKNLFEFPNANFTPDRDYDVKFFNKYILYAIDAIKSSYYIGNNDIYFNKVFKWIKSHKLKNIYIFAKGEVGITLEYFLKQNDINIVKFIDDNINSEDCLSYGDFKSMQHLDKEAKGIIIATYKCSVDRKITNKLLEYQDTNTKVLSLISITEDTQV